MADSPERNRSPSKNSESGSESSDDLGPLEKQVECGQVNADAAIEESQVLHTQKDTGYAWVVLAACGTITILTVGAGFSIAVYFVEFQTIFQKGPGDLGWLGALHLGMVFGFGPVSAELVLRFGHRRVVMAGSLLAALGIGLSALATELWMVHLSYGFVAGIGANMGYIPAVTVLTQYFDVYREAAFAVPAAGIGLGTFIVPPMYKYFVNNFSWQGALLLTAGVALQNMILGALLVPNEEITIQQRTMADTWRDFISLCKQYRFDLYTIQAFFFNIGCSIIFVMVVDYAEKRGVPSHKAVILLSIVGATSTLGRVGVIFIRFVPINRQLLYLTCCGLSGVASLFLPIADSFGKMAGILIIYGSMFGYQSGLITAVSGECAKGVTVDLPFGIVIFLSGVGSLIGNLAAGWLFQLTGNYDVSFYFSGGSTILAALLMVPNLFPLDGFKEKIFSASLATAKCPSNMLHCTKSAER